MTSAGTIVGWMPPTIMGGSTSLRSRNHRASRRASGYCWVRHEKATSPAPQSRIVSRSSASVGTGGRFSFRLTSRVSCPRARSAAESAASPWLNPICV